MLQGAPLQHGRRRLAAAAWVRAGACSEGCSASPPRLASPPHAPLWLLSHPHHRHRLAPRGADGGGAGGRGAGVSSGRRRRHHSDVDPGGGRQPAGAAGYPSQLPPGAGGGLLRGRPVGGARAARFQRLQLRPHLPSPCSAFPTLPHPALPCHPPLSTRRAWAPYPVPNTCRWWGGRGGRATPPPAKRSSSARVRRRPCVGCGMCCCLLPHPPLSLLPLTPSCPTPALPLPASHTLAGAAGGQEWCQVCGLLTAPIPVLQSRVLPPEAAAAFGPWRGRGAAVCCWLACWLLLSGAVHQTAERPPAAPCCPSPRRHTVQLPSRRPRRTQRGTCSSCCSRASPTAACAASATCGGSCARPLRRISRRGPGASRGLGAQGRVGASAGTAAARADHSPPAPPPLACPAAPAGPVGAGGGVALCAA